MPAESRSAHHSTPPSLWEARLIHLAVVGVLIYFLGGAWDVFWHMRLGRETVFSPPHLVLYAGLSLVFASLGGGVLLSYRGRQRAATGAFGLPLPGGLRLDPGLFIAGMGALMSLSSAPIDEAWHLIFGIDLTIWSPPHIQLILGVALAILGLMVSLAVELNRRDPGRLSLRLRPWSRDGRHWALAALAALLGMALSGLVLEWDLDIPAYSAVFYPPTFAAFTVGPLLLGARALGWRWGATAVALTTTVLILLLQSVFVVLASGRLVLPVPLLGALVVDLAWQRDGYRLRPLRVAAVGGLAGVSMAAARMAYMGAFQHIYWPWEAWQWGLPLAAASGAASALLAARIGVALRPLPRPEREATSLVRWAGRLAGPLILALALGAPGAAGAHGPAPEVELRFLGEPPQVGRTFTVEVGLLSGEAAAREVELRLSRQLQELRSPVQPGAEPGVWRASFRPPRPGTWNLSIRMQQGGLRWLGWTFVHVPPPGRPSPHPAEPVTLRMIVDRTLPPEEVNPTWLWLGRASVLAYSGLLLLAAAYALRLAEGESRRLLSPSTGGRVGGGS